MEITSKPYLSLSVLIECGKLLQRGGYRIKVLNTINFKKSMKYNPFAYLRSEKDILKLVNTIIANTKGDGEKSGEDFWVKAEKLYYTALIGYIWYEAPDEEKNFTTLLEMINASEAREDDEDFQNPVDLMFERLEEKDPEHFAVKQYKKYKLAAGVATSGFWDASGYPAVQEAYPAAPGSALIGIKFFVSVSGMIYPFLVVHNASSGNWKLNVIIPLVMSIVCLVLAIIAPFAYDDQKKASEGKKDKSDNAVQAEIDAAKAAMLVKPNKFIVFLVMFYAFLCMAIMYGAQQYTKAFGLSVCGLSEIQAAGMTSIYTIGSICAVLFWAFMMAKLKWNPLKVVLIDSICTAVALAGVLFIHQVAIIYIAIAMLGFFAAGGALQTGLAVVQLFNPGPKGRNTGIYYTFMGAASYLIPVVAAQLTKSSGEASAVYSLMIMLLVFAILAILSSLYLVAQHKKIFGKSAL